jgi:transcriptional/translational regulatory protein YebC/TACO1
LLNNSFRNTYVSKIFHVAADYKSSMFEYYGFGGVGFIVNVLTDNDNRAYKDISFVAKGCNLKQAAANSVAFKFNTKARLSVQSVVDEVQTHLFIFSQSSI